MAQRWRVPGLVRWPLLGLATYGALYFAVNRMAIYYPHKFPQGFWDLQPRLGAADVWLRARDGVRLNGWWTSPSGPRVATLFLHGNAGNLTHRALHVHEITSAGSALLALDYRGYGKSEGRPSEKGLYADAEAGYDYLLAAGFQPGRIVLHGESLGTAVAVDLAARRECGGIVLEAPFTSGKEMAGRVLPVLGPLLVWSFDTKRKIGKVRAPLLVLHGDRDEIVPIELGRALYEAALQPKSFWAIPGAGHNNIVPTAGAEYRRRLRAFYESLK